MTSEQKQVLLSLLRLACAEEDAELDEGPLATVEIPTNGGGVLNLPVVLLESTEEQ
jgi:hypothetical protein